MEQQKTPFLNVNVKCPVCEHNFTQNKIKAGLYSVIEKESDQHPKFYKWTDSDFNSFNPQYYSIWMCPNCKFTDLYESFERAESDLKLNGLKRLYRTADATKKTFVFEVAKYIDFNNMNFETAMNLHLAAIFVNEMPTKESEKSYSKLARLYLRTAWLYREKFGGIQKSEVTKTPLSKVLESLQKIEKNYSQLEASANALVGNIQLRLNEIYSALPDVPLNNPYYLVLGNFLKNVKGMAGDISKIKGTTVLDQQGKITIESSTSGNNYYTFQSYLDFLMYISGFWSGLPFNEKESLSTAVKNYSTSYLQEDTFDTIEKRLGAVDLMTDLYVRLEDFETALHYVSEIYRSATKDRQQLYQKMNMPKADGTFLSMLEKDRISSQIARINSALNRAADKKKDLEEKRMELLLPKVQEIIKNNPDLSEDEMLAKMEEHLVPANVAIAMKEKGLIQQLATLVTEISVNGEAPKS